MIYLFFLGVEVFSAVNFNLAEIKAFHQEIVFSGSSCGVRVLVGGLNFIQCTSLSEFCLNYTLSGCKLA